MRSFIQRNLTYANVMATIAVFVALGGSAFAARYVITSSRQIKDGAVTGADVKNSSLTGGDVKNSSLTGGDIKNKSLTPGDFTGSVQGPPGLKGNPGPVTGDLPSGATLRGNYAVILPDGAQAVDAWVPISFGLRLPSEPTVYVVAPGGPKPAPCQGTVYMPEALQGHLCIYRQNEDGLAYPAALRIAIAEAPDSTGSFPGAAGRTGLYLRFLPSGTGVHYARGSWAVTAP